MAWLEPFIATLPQWLAAARNTNILNNNDNDHTSTHMNNENNNHLININALSMYQRAIAIQETNSENVNSLFSPVHNASEFSMERWHSFGCRHNDILSDDEYIDLHSRLSIEELRSELYDDCDEAESWLKIEENELIINNKKKKLNEKEWKILHNLMKKNGNNINYKLKLNNIVLDETASRYLEKLMINLRILHIENGYFLNKSCNITYQNEGMNDDLLQNDSDFDFNAFCRAILCNKNLKEMVIINTNLNDILCENEERKDLESFIHILSNHNGLQYVNLSANNLCFGSIYSPFQTYQYHIEMDADEHQFIYSLFPISSSSSSSRIHRKHKRICHKVVFKQEEQEERPPGIVMDEHNEPYLMLQI